MEIMNKEMAYARFKGKEISIFVSHKHDHGQNESGLEALRSCCAFSGPRRSEKSAPISAQALLRSPSHLVRPLRISLCFIRFSETAPRTKNFKTFKSLLCGKKGEKLGLRGRSRVDAVEG